MTRRGPRAAPPGRPPLPALLALCVLLLLSALPLGAQEIPAGLDQGLFEVRVGSGPPITVPVLVDEELGVRLPLLHVLEGTGLPYRLSADSTRLSIPLLGGEGEAVLDVPRGEMRLRGRSVSLRPDELVRYSGEIYLGTARAAELLEARVEVDLATLQVAVLRDPPFPTDQRALIEARRELLLRQAREDSAVLSGVAYRAGSGVGIVDWSVGAHAVPELRSSGRVVFGAAVLGGALTLGGTAGTAEAGRETLYSSWLANYTRVFPAGTLLRQLQAGDVTAGGLQAQSFRGLLLSNAPYRPQLAFGRILVNPDIPPGWEYEVYQGGRLLGFSEGAERDPVTVPLEYGSTRVHVRMYGPAGEEVVSELRYMVPFSQVAPGQWHYTVGGGACPTSACRDHAFLDLRHGLTPWVTLGGGASTTHANHRRDVQPHAMASVAFPGGGTAELRHLSHAFTRLSGSYFGRGPLWAAGQTGINHPQSGVPSFLGGASSRWDAGVTVGASRSTLPRLVRSLRLGARVEGEMDGPRDRVQLLAGWSAIRSVFELVYEDNPFQEHPLVSLQATTALPDRGPRWLRGRAFTSRMAWGGEQVQQVDLATSVRLHRTGDLGVVARWDRRSLRPSLNLGYSADLGVSRVQSRVYAPASGPASMGITADGGVAYGEVVGLHGTPQNAQGSAGVAGTVFYDHDGDGRFGPGDEPLREARVLVGALRATTDARGRYEIWGVPAYDVAPVRVDTLSLADPGWVPLREEVRVRPVPHTFTPIDFALTPTREVSGRLAATPGVPTVGGVTVEIEEAASGTVHRAVTFSDGEYYVSRLRPGDYRLRVAESSLQALRARSEPGSLAFTVPAGGEIPFVELPPLTLLPDRPTEP